MEENVSKKLTLCWSSNNYEVCVDRKRDMVPKKNAFPLQLSFVFIFAVLSQTHNMNTFDLK